MRLVRNGWVGGFEETLKLIDYEYAHGRRGVTALDNVRRAILDELGLTDNVVAKPNTLCPLVFRSDTCGVKSSEYYDSCGKTFDECKKLGNAKNFGGIGHDKIPGAKETSTRGADYCDCPYDDNCSDGMRDRCKSDANLERIERLAKSVRQLQPWRTAREFYGVTKHGDK